MSQSALTSPALKVTPPSDDQTASNAPAPLSRLAGTAETIKTQYRSFNWELLFARLLYWLAVVVLKGTVTVVYFSVASTGLKRVFADLGMKLYKVPGFGFLEDYTLTYRIDLSHVFVAVPLLGAWVFWSLMLQLYILTDDFEQRFRHFNIERTKQVIVSLGVTIITADALLFGAAFTMARWGTPKVTVGAVFATIAYVAVIGLVSFVTLWLGKNIKTLKNQEN